MPPVNILIKPASSACNMACTYCFYKDVASHREVACEGMLSLARMEAVIRAGMEYAEHICSFAFQGGEPTLAGLDFFKGVVQLQKKYKKEGVQIHNAIQTNGYTIDEKWAQFFAENGFLVGLSLDGPAELHNLNRKDNAGKNTFSRIMQSVQLLTKYKVQFNILNVVTGKNARAAEKIYRFYARHEFGWLQFIPCLEPMEEERGKSAYHLSAEEYGAFLIRIFDLWFADLRQGKYVSIRHIDNWIAMLLGEKPEACNMAGHCSVQFVVEGDGGVYPCDFYVLDKWRMGTVGEESFAEMCSGSAARAFIEESLPVPGACKACRWGSLCRNGCKRDRMETENGAFHKNYYCGAYQKFFSAREEQLVSAARLILQMRRQKAAII